jgi:hypothetical protein
VTKPNDYLPGRTHSQPRHNQPPRSFGWLFSPFPRRDAATLKRMTDPVENAKAAAAFYAAQERNRDRTLPAWLRPHTVNLTAQNPVVLSRARTVGEAAALARRMGLSVESSARPSRFPSRGVWPATPLGGYVWPVPAPPPPTRVVPVGRGSNHFGPCAVDLGPVTARTRMAIKHWAVRLKDARRYQRRRVLCLSALVSIREDLEGIEWDWPPAETRWKPRRIFDHDKDRWV